MAHKTRDGDSPVLRFGILAAAFVVAAEIAGAWAARYLGLSGDAVVALLLAPFVLVGVFGFFGLMMMVPPVAGPGTAVKPWLERAREPLWRTETRYVPAPVAKPTELAETPPERTLH